MDVDENLEYLADHRCLQWLQLLVSKKPHIPAWVTEFHPQRLPCRLEEPWLHGSYNMGLRVVFSNSEEWFVRFPWRGKIIAEHVDEKVASEVAALEVIRKQTSIPVPEVKAWGLAHQNELGLGPYIIEEFIQGQKLKQILRGPDQDSSVLNDKLDEEKVDIIYRQIAQFMLQLFSLDFTRIGSLVAGSPRLHLPLTLTANEITRLSGVTVLGITLPLSSFPRLGISRANNKADAEIRELATTEEYFEYVVEQHWRQFAKQRNSVYGVADGKENYVFHKVLKSLVSHHVWPEYNKGPFKLICDDFGPANMLVNNEEELKIVGVVDLEWSYAGPAQLLATCPWWLLQERPNAWDPSIERRNMFLKYFNKYAQILEEEEGRLPPDQRQGLSALVRRSEEQGTMWYHMVLQGSLIYYTDFPCVELAASSPDWLDLAARVPEGEAQAFVTAKREGLRQYREERDETKRIVDEVYAGRRTHQDVIDHVEALYK